MPRYYLHIRHGDALIEDPDGSELPDLDAARTEALDGAREILADSVRSGEVIDDRSFEITDGAGAVLANIILRDAIKFA